MLFLIISFLFAYNIFFPIYNAEEIIIPYGLHPFDICQKNPVLWQYIKLIFIICYFISNLVFSNFIYNRFISHLNLKFIFNFKKIKKENKNIKIGNSLNLLIGETKNKEKVYIPESGLFQNILITRYNRFW